MMKKIVLVGGVFDILHFGHISFLREAKKLGNYLIVAIESDKRVKKLKGENRPFHSQDQRKEILESLNFVDQVIVLKDEMKDEDYMNLVLAIRPDVIASSEKDVSLDKQKLQAKKIGAKHVVIPNIKTHSTTKIAKLLKLE